MYANGYANFNQMGEMRDHWTPYNTETDIPRADYEDRNLTSRFVEDGSFIRLQSVNLSYNLSSAATKSIGLKSFQIYSNIENVFLWTKYTGFDPEVTSFMWNGLINGVDWNGPPNAKSVLIGLNLNY